MEDNLQYQQKVLLLLKHNLIRAQSKMKQWKVNISSKIKEEKIKRIESNHSNTCCLRWHDHHLVQYKQRDMVSFHLKIPFSVFACVFSSTFSNPSPQGLDIKSIWWLWHQEIVIQDPQTIMLHDHALGHSNTHCESSTCACTSIPLILPSFSTVWSYCAAFLLPPLQIWSQ